MFITSKNMYNNLIKSLPKLAESKLENYTTICTILYIKRILICKKKTIDLKLAQNGKYKQQFPLTLNTDRNIYKLVVGTRFSLKFA